jgi:RNA polymerase sigma factor (sigma-70 family)
MEDALSIAWMSVEQDRRISETVEREEARLRRFIRRRVADESDADDILQEVFYELVETYRLMKPVEQLSAWLFRVARNRITDLFRRRRPGSVPGSATASATGDDEQGPRWEDLLPSPDAGPEAAYAREVLLEELEAALAELPSEQREVFLAHEFDGSSFKELSAMTGVGVNTLLARKRYAVLHLRERLRAIREEFEKA